MLDVPVMTYYSQSRGGYSNLCVVHMPLSTAEAIELMDLEFIGITSEPCAVCDCE